jgi:CRP-like cAMP-binding protein
MLIVMDVKMAFSDHLILAAVRQLTIERPDDYLTYAEIAQRAAGCAPITVMRSMKRLIKAGALEREGGRSVGFRYRFPDMPSMGGAA